MLEQVLRPAAPAFVVAQDAFDDAAGLNIGAIKESTEGLDRGTGCLRQQPLAERIPV